MIHSFRTIINDYGAQHGLIIAKKDFNQVCCIGVSAISLSYDDVKIFDEITKLYGVETPLSLKDSYEYSKTISNPSTANTERFGAENNTYSYGYGLVKYPL